MTKSINEMTVDFPGSEDFNGAVKGIIMLHDTYFLNLEAIL
jgi:hypothetical protein